MLTTAVRAAQLVIPVAAPGEPQPQTVALPAYAGFAGNEKEELDNPHDFKASHVPSDPGFSASAEAQLDHPHLQEPTTPFPFASLQR